MKESFKFLSLRKHSTSSLSERDSNSEANQKNNKKPVENNNAHNNHPPAFSQEKKKTFSNLFNVLKDDEKEVKHVADDDRVLPFAPRPRNSNETFDLVFKQYDSFSKNLKKIKVSFLNQQREKKNSWNMLLLEPIKKISSDFETFYRNEAYTISQQAEMKEYWQEPTHATQLVEGFVREYEEAHTGFIEFLDNSMLATKTIQKKLSERENVLQQLNKISEKAPEKEKILQNQLSNLTAEAITEMKNFTEGKAAQIKEKLTALFLRQTHLITGTSSAWLGLAPLVEYSPVVSSSIIEPKVQSRVSKDLTSYIISEYSPLALFPTCQSCKRAIPMDLVEEHSQICPKVDDWEFITNFTADRLTEYIFSNKNLIKKLIRREGIPASMRGKVWPSIVGTSARQRAYEQEGISYKDLLQTFGNKRSSCIEQIEKDVTRTLHQQSPEEVLKLRNVLLVYSFINPEIGYCQSMNFIASFLLLYLSEAEALWALDKIVEEMLPPNYFTTVMSGIRTDLHVFKYLLDLKFPAITIHFQKLEVEIQSFLTGWFLCLFTTALAFDDAQHFLDVFLNEGDKMIFRLGLAIFQLNMEPLLKIKRAEDVFLYVRDLPKRANFKEAIQVAGKIKITTTKLKALRLLYEPLDAPEKNPFAWTEDDSSHKEASKNLIARRLTANLTEPLQATQSASNETGQYPHVDSDSSSESEWNSSFTLEPITTNLIPSTGVPPLESHTLESHTLESHTLESHTLESHTLESHTPQHQTEVLPVTLKPNQSRVQSTEKPPVPQKIVLPKQVPPPISKKVVPVTQKSEDDTVYYSEENDETTEVHFTEEDEWNTEGVSLASTPLSTSFTGATSTQPTFDDLTFKFVEIKKIEMNKNTPWSDETASAPSDSVQSLKREDDPIHPEESSTLIDLVIPSEKIVIPKKKYITSKKKEKRKD